ncbi:hypothetical protein E4T39_00213 [Aureobasidium subglaciale]|nr:hypothetical protein E4T39_00213 [Aureobasidium subglaciale]
MARNSDSPHGDPSSAASSDEESVSDNGTISGPPSTVPTANNSPFIGPRNHPGIPAQYHPAATVPALSQALQLVLPQAGQDPFASQIDEVEVHLGILGTGNHVSPWGNPAPYRAVLYYPPRTDGIDMAELHAVEADVMFARHYYDYDPEDDYFPASGRRPHPAGTRRRRRRRNHNLVPNPPAFQYGGESNDDGSDNDEEYLYLRDSTASSGGRDNHNSQYISFAEMADTSNRPRTDHAGTAILGPSLPMLIPSILRADPETSPTDDYANAGASADVVSEMTGTFLARSASASPTPTITPEQYNADVVAANTSIQSTAPSESVSAVREEATFVPPSAIALYQELRNLSVPSETTEESPILPHNWATLTSNFHHPSYYHLAHGTMWDMENDNYTSRPYSAPYYEEEDGGDENDGL